MEILCFPACFVTDTTARDGVEANNCRAQVQARCTLTSERTGQSLDYLMCQPCIGEHMYRPGQITQVPTSEVLIICSATQDDYMLLKKHADHKDDVIQMSRVGEHLRLHDGGTACRTAMKRTLKSAPARRLDNARQIVDAVFEDALLAGRTTIWNSDRSWRAILEYPIGYINCLPRISGFTVDVGPILAPDFDELNASSPIACLRPTFLLYKALDHVELVYRVPTPIGNGSTQTLHSSKVVHSPAQCEIFQLQ